jgi:hypothetical protein
MLVWHYMGLNIMQVSKHQLKQNELIRQATLAFDHFWLQQHCDRFKHPWTPNEVMSRLEELLGMYAPGVLARIRRTGSLDLHVTAEILDYAVNMNEGTVVQHVQLCKSFASHPVMTNHMWQETCFNRFSDKRELQWLIGFIVSHSRNTVNE